MAKRTFASMTEMLDFFKKTGSEGGKARAANLSKAELSAIGKKGAKARWAKKATERKPAKGKKAKSK